MQDLDEKALQVPNELNKSVWQTLTESGELSSKDDKRFCSIQIPLNWILKREKKTEWWQFRLRRERCFWYKSDAKRVHCNEQHKNGKNKECNPFNVCPVLTA